MIEQGGRQVPRSRLVAVLLAATIALATVIAALPASSVQAVDVELVGYVGGSIGAVATSGGRVYLGEGNRLVVAVTHDETMVGQYESPSLSSLIRDIEVHESAAVVAAVGYGGLAIIDSQDITDPLFSLLPRDVVSEAWGVAVNGNLVYVAGGTYGVLVVDMSDATNPHSMTAIPVEPASIDVAVSGDHLYVLAGPARPWPAVEGYAVHVFDVSNLDSVEEVGTVDINDGIGALAVDGETLYLGVLGGVVAVDVSDPAAAVRLARVECGRTMPALQGLGHATAIEVVGQYVVLATAGGQPRYGGLCTFDASDPTALAWVANPVLHPTGMVGVAGAGSAVVAVGGSSGEIYVLPTPTESPVAPVVKRIGGTIALAVDASLGVLATGGGLASLDLGTPLLPVLTGTSPAATTARAGVEAQIQDGENLAQALSRAYDLPGLYLSSYRLSASQGFDKISSSVFAGGWDSGPARTTAAGSSLFVANRRGVAGLGGGIRLFDRSDPANLHELAFLETDADINGMAALTGGRVSAIEARDLLIVDFGVQAPQVLVRHRLPGIGTALAALNDLVVVASGTELRFFDAASRDSIREFGMLRLPGRVVEIGVGEAIHRSIVLAALEPAHNAEQGAGYQLMVIDAGDPGNPSVVGATILCGEAGDIEFAEGVALVVSGDCGLAVVHLGDTIEPSPSPTSDQRAYIPLASANQASGGR